MTVKKLIGNDPNQVSLNRDLGSAAFQNANSFLPNLGMYENVVSTGSTNYTANTFVTIIPADTLPMGGYIGFFTMHDYGYSDWQQLRDQSQLDRASRAMGFFTVSSDWDAQSTGEITLFTSSRSAGSMNGNLIIAPTDVNTNTTSGVKIKYNVSLTGSQRSNYVFYVKAYRIF